MLEPVETPYQPNAALLTGHFREGRGYRAFRPRGVADWLLVLTLSGSGRFGFSGGEVTTGADSWVLLPPGTAHDYRVADAASGWELLWAHFQPRAEWHAFLDWPNLGGGLRGMEGNAAPADQFLRVHQQLTSGRRRAEALAMNAMEALLLACDDHLAPGGTGRDQRIERAVGFVEAHLDERLGVARIAGEVGLSPSRLAHLFRDITGLSVQAHVEQRRMLRAADLLRRTVFPIKRIAAEVGFESPFYFSRRFAKWSGQSPVAFRRGG